MEGTDDDVSTLNVDVCNGVIEIGVVEKRVEGAEDSGGVVLISVVTTGAVLCRVVRIVGVVDC